MGEVSQNSAATAGAWPRAEMLSPPSLEGVVVCLDHGVSEDALLGVDCVQVLLVQGGQARLNLGDAALSEAGLDAILYLLEDLQRIRQRVSKAGKPRCMNSGKLAPADDIQPSKDCFQGVGQASRTT